MAAAAADACQRDGDAICHSKTRDLPRRRAARRTSVIAAIGRAAMIEAGLGAAGR